MSSIYQDWEPVTIHNKNFIKNKNNNNNNKPKPKNNYDEEGQEIVPKRIEYTNEMINALQVARNAKNMTQTQLAKKLSFDAKTVTDIETKKSAYNPTLYTKLMVTLGVDRESIKKLLHQPKK